VALADDGINLPVANLGPLIDSNRPVLNSDSVNDLATALSAAAIALAAPLLTAQVSVQLASQPLVGIDIRINPFMADLQ